MRRSLVARGLLDAEFGLTDAGNEYAVGLIRALAKRSPKVKPMGHADYQYQPRSEKSRAKQSVTVRKRLGIPPGHRRVYGVHVPEAIAEKIRPLATEIAGKQGFEAAKAFVAEAEANDWKYDPAKVPAKNGNAWTEERRRKASEGAKAAHARRRARLEEGERRRAEQRQKEEAVNAQTKVQAATRDDGVREMHGVVGQVDNKGKRVTIIEDSNWIGLDGTGYETTWFTASQARYLADKLQRLAIRLETRQNR
jgi:hypothetical protein